MCCTKALRCLNLVVGNIDCNNRARAADMGTLNCIETDTASSDYCNMAARRNFCCVGYCAKASDDTACKQ